MEINISLKTRNDIERFILIMNIGIMNAIKKGAMSIEESENYIYSPYSVGKLKNLGINKDIIRLVELGCELEDVESLIPNKLSDAIDEISNKSIKLFQSMPKATLPLEKWID